jgi:GT2 family glycosyltransferase
MTDSKISVVVPVWNGRALVEKLLASLRRQTRPAAEVLVMDNGSTDGAAERARALGAQVYGMGHNAGFAAAVNRGIEAAIGRWIAVVNSDVELAPDYLARLLEAAESENIWFATGKVLAAGSADRIDGTWDAISRGGAVWRVGHGHRDGQRFSQRRRIALAPWTAVLLRRDLFSRVGLLEASFESYLEDVDFGLRCAARGLGGLYVPEAVAWHQGSAALGRWHPRTVRLIARNQVLLLARHYPRPLLRKWARPILVAQLLWGGVALRHGNGAAWVRGKWEGLRGWRAARAQREKSDLDALSGLVTEDEHLIHEMQAAARFEPYWRLYFLLAGSGSK